MLPKRLGACRASRRPSRRWQTPSVRGGHARGRSRRSDLATIAGEFARASGGDYGRGRGYIYAYGQELLKPLRGFAVVRPRIWGYHAYVDMENGWRNPAHHLRPPYRYPRDLKAECTKYLAPRTAWKERRGHEFQQTDCFVNYFAGTAHNGWDHGAFWHHPHVWLDEQGDLLRSADLTPLDANYLKTKHDPRPTELNPNYNKAKHPPLGNQIAGNRQVAGAREFQAFGSRYHGAVQRIYYYHWGPGGNAPTHGGFDSALLDIDLKRPDPLDHRPRPVFCALTFQPLGNCNGSRTATPTSP